MKTLKRTFLRTFVIDLVLLGFLFGLGAFAKNAVGGFFDTITSYQAQISQLEPGLAEQSTSALLQMETLVGSFSQLVMFTYIFMVFIVPLLIYLSITLSQSASVNQVKGKLNWKFLMKSVALGLPILALFFLVENSFATSFSLFLGEGSNTFLFVSLFVLFALLGYSWYVLMTSMLITGKIQHKNLYLKFHRFFPWYFSLSILYFIVFAITGFALIRFLTESFIGYGWISMLLIGLGSLALIQLIRYRFVLSVKRQTESL